MNTDARRLNPAAERNRGPILAELQRRLPPHGLALEIASGSGQHAAHLAAGLPGWRWQPTEFDAALLPSISAWTDGLPQVLSPVQLDVTAATWADVPPAVDLIFCANVLHIAPWPVTAALMAGAARHLSADGLLVTYGPYIEADVPTAPSNEAFDADLRARNPAWGLRRLEAVAAEAAAHGLLLQERVPMPANNLLLLWARCRH